MVDVSRVMRSIKIEDFDLYLRACGWGSEFENGRIKTYWNPKHDSVEIVLPQKQLASDYELAVGLAVELLAATEARDERDIIAQVLHPRHDILRFRVASEDNKDGTLDLVSGLDLFSGVENAVLSSARSVLRPQPYYTSLKVGNAERLLNACRLGQTQEGSYIVTVLVPLQLPAEASDNDEALFKEGSTTSFSRRVTMNLLDSAGELCISDAFAESTDVPIKISSNLCEALETMHPSEVPTSLTIRSIWSPLEPVLGNTPSSVEIRDEVFPKIRNLAVRLRPTFLPKVSNYLGKVEVLKGKENDQNLMEGEIVIAFLEEGNETRRAHLKLSTHDYELACDAHKKALHVEVSGTLLRNRTHYYIQNYSNFRVIGSAQTELLT